MSAVQASSRINNILKNPYLADTCNPILISNLKLGSYGGAWYTKHIHTTFIAISELFMELDNVFITSDRLYHCIQYSEHHQINLISCYHV